jgi:hypothetical protein
MCVELFRGPSTEQAADAEAGHGSGDNGMCPANILNAGGVLTIMQHNTSPVATEVSMNEEDEANILGCKAQLDMIEDQSKGEKTAYHLSKSRVYGNVLNGNVSEAMNLVSDLHTGNSVLNFKQGPSTKVQAVINQHAASTTFTGLSDLEEKVMDKSQETSALVQQYIMPMSTPVKRSKRREMILSILS